MIKIENEEKEKKKGKNSKRKRATFYLLSFLVGFLPFVLVAKMPIPGIVAGTVTLLGFGGLRIVPEKEVWIIEFLGRYWRIYWPGLNWIFPIPPIMSIKNKAPLWEFPVPLYLERNWVDFKKGGSSRLDQLYIWIEIAAGVENKRELLIPEEREKLGEEKIKKAKKAIEAEVLKATYDIADYKGAVREGAENILGGLLNSVTVEGAMGNPESEEKPFEEKPKTEKKKKAEKEKKAGEKERIIKNRNFIDALKKHMPDEFKALEETYRGWGITPKNITLTDYGWSDEVKSERRRIYEQDRRKVAAAHTAEKRRREIGEALGLATDTLTDHGYPDDKAQEVAPLILEETIAAESGSLKRIEWINKGGTREETVPTAVNQTAQIAASAVIAAEIVRERGGKKEKTEKKKTEEEERIAAGMDILGS